MDKTEVTWRKSSRSSDKANCVEVGWRKSSRSGNTSNCVEIGSAPGWVYVRDTKDRSDGTLAVSGGTWSQFLANIKAGQLDR